MSTISIPPKTQERMARLIMAAQSIQSELDAIQETLREALDVPEDYTLYDVRAGFVPPQPTTGAQTPAGQESAE